MFLLKWPRRDQTNASATQCAATFAFLWIQPKHHQRCSRLAWAQPVRGIINRHTLVSVVHFSAGHHRNVLLGLKDAKLPCTNTDSSMYLVQAHVGPGARSGFTAHF
jgi:hypothetical protein